MTFSATVVRVLIASPGDTGTARQIIREAAEDWNSLHAEEVGVILLPVMWERDATPEMGDRPQGIINRQLVDIADVLVGAFWTKLGTPTGQAESGTVEEIEQCIADGKPVLIYFSDEPVALASVDTAEYERLQSFKRQLQERGLLDAYSSENELYRKVTAALTRRMRDQFNVVTSTPTSPSRIDTEGSPLGSGPRAAPFARIYRERELSGLSRSGKPTYRTRARLVIENRGEAAAEELSFGFEVPEGVEGSPPHTVHLDAPVRKLQAGGALEYPLALHLGMAPHWEIVFGWSEDGKPYEDRQTLG